MLKGVGGSAHNTSIMHKTIFIAGRKNLYVAKNGLTCVNKSTDTSNTSFEKLTLKFGFIIPDGNVKLERLNNASKSVKSFGGKGFGVSGVSGANPPPKDACCSGVKSGGFICVGLIGSQLNNTPIMYITIKELVHLLDPSQQFYLKYLQLVRLY
jgi:hypothetical protein